MHAFHYLATCPAGFELEVSRLLPDMLQGADVSRASGGAVWFSLPSPLTNDSIPAFVSNVFFVLREWNTSANPFSELVKQSARKSGLDRLPEGYRTSAFRVRFSRENRFESVDKAVTASAEKFIATVTGSLPDRLGSGGEYWFIVRSESWSAFALRLEGADRSAGTPAQGELSAALASLVVLRAARDREPKTVLDPCAGSGSIPERCAALLSDARVIASDIDPSSVARMEHRFAGNPRVSVHRDDLLTLLNIADASVDILVTDPPWGSWEEGGYRDAEKLKALYSGLLASASRVLASGGRLCVLTGAKREFEEAVAANRAFAASSRHEGYRMDILVNGKKAALYALDK